MKISEIGSIVQHPAVAKEAEFVSLLQSKDQDEIIEFILNDSNAEGRRLYMLRHLDELLGDLQDSYDVGDLIDFVNGADSDDMSPEEADEIARDLKFPPYHLSPVEETEDDDTPTGEYEVCQRCGGEGCIECEEGLKDITGMHKALNLDDFIED